MRLFSWPAGTPVIPFSKIDPVALNIQTFKTRALTAIVFALVMLTGLLTNGYLYTLLFIIILAGSTWEFIRLQKMISAGGKNVSLIAGLLYSIVPFVLMIDLGTAFFRNGDLGSYKPDIPCVLIFSIWINDTMAYIVGSFIGKSPFSKISPKKTWEGTVGGAILCIVVITALSVVVQTDLTTADVGIIATLAAVFGTIGDLLES